MRVRSTSFALGFFALLLLALPVSAGAAPILGIQIAHSPEMPPSNSEKVNYRIAVKNDAVGTPEIGTELPCRRGVWRSEAELGLSFSYQWVRDGVRLESSEDVAHGSQAPTYTVQAADAGSQLQCLVTGENFIENPLDHTVGHRIAAAYASQPATPVAPVAAEPGPTLTVLETAARPSLKTETGKIGAERPNDQLTCTAPTSGWNTIATASTMAGSKTLTEVSTAVGKVDGTSLEVGSKIVHLLPERTTGQFRKGQTFKPAGGIQIVPAGTVIEAIEGNTLTLSKPVQAKGQSSVTEYPVVAGALPFEVGQEIIAAGLLVGTTITAVNGLTVTISAAATATKAEVPITDQAVGIGVWSFEWLLNGVPRSGGAGQGEVTATTATTSTFKIAAAELEQPGVFQCAAWAAKDGQADGEMSLKVRTTSPAPEAPDALTPFLPVSPGISIEAGSPTVGPVQLHVELPGGADTRVWTYIANGWNCTASQPSGEVHASFNCERADTLAPQQSYPPLEVLTQIGPELEQPARALAEVSGGGSAPAAVEDLLTQGEPVPFGIESLQTMVLDQGGGNYTQAGGHPDSAAVALALNSRQSVLGNSAPRAVEFLKEIDTDIPQGFLANPRAAPRECATLGQVSTDTYASPTCPRESIVGSVDVNTNHTKLLTGLPLYLLTPERGAPAQLVFSINGYPGGAVRFSLIPRLRPAEGYAIRVEAPSIAKEPLLQSVSVKLCGYGVNVGPPLGGKGTQYNGVANVTACKDAGEPGANPKPFIRNPTRCSGAPPVTKVSIDSWENPDVFHSAEAVSPEVTGCENVPFEPTIEFEPTTKRAESPTGLDVTLKVPSKGLETPEAISQSDLKKAVVTLPEGMSVNPSAADGLGACTPEQISLGTNEPVDCPNSSKIGSAAIMTPLLEAPLEGSVYLAEQGHNPFGSLLALYLVAESAERGILVKIPGRVEPKADGQLVAEFDENPQVPFSSLELHFASGSRAALMTPPSCGTYGVRSALYPWANPGQALESTSSFQITEGPGGGDCPKGALEPKLSAGLQNPIAGTTSPFITQLSREDGTRRITGLELALPPGLSAYLKGVPYCADAALASISEAEGTGRTQIEHPSCPSASQVGTVTAGVGAGPSPYYVNTGRLYLAGPYKGAPISIAAVIPAVAGPFDLGTVVVRNPAYVDPETAQVTVKSDPIPAIVHGIPVDARDIRIDVNRPHFTLAPTSCETKSVTAQVAGEGGGSAQVSNRFQVGGCEGLAFRPTLKIKLDGATKRIGHPALKATLTYPEGGSYANVARAQVNLPHGEFLDQGNLNKTCTKPVLLAGNCPASTVYGKVKAWTPLLEKPLEGSVYLVGGYGYKLPALVAELNGQIRILLVGKVDSGPNKGIRNTFEVVPDAPVEKFVLEMKGGPKYGLLENSENLCKAPKAKRKAIVSFVGQNGKVEQSKPVVADQCGKRQSRHSR